MQSDLKVGFIGTGRMGMPMVERLRAGGFEVAATARRAEVAARLSELGVGVRPTAAHVGSVADVLCVCTFDDRQVVEVLLGEQGALAAMHPGATVVIHTTGSPKLTERVSGVAPRGVAILDAPVSGTAADIAAGAITLLVGGSADRLDSVRPVLNTYADPVLHVGRLGDGQRTKLLNNLLFAVHVRLAHDVGRLVSRLGLDGATVIGALSRSSGRSYGLELASVGPDAVFERQPQASAGPVSYGRRIRDLAEADPTGVAVVFAAQDGSQRTVTWGELDRRANQIARLLQRRGAHRGERVTVEIANSPLLVEVVLAIWKLGGVPIPVRWDLPVWERQRLLAVADPAVAVGEHDLPLLEATSAEPDDALPDVTPPQAHGICSSGSTGAPKIIVAARPGLWDDANAEPFPSSWGPIPRPQVVLVPAPLYHTNGFSTLTSLLAGDRLVLLQKFDASRVVDLIEQHRVSTFTATPTMLQRIAAVPDIEHRDLSSLRWVLQGAAVIAPSLVRRWIDLIGSQQFFMAYGMSEGLGLAAIRGDEWEEHPGSVGKGYRQTEIRVLDGDHQDLPPGEIGEIYLRSPSSALYEYLGGEPRLAVTDDGFSTAGDVGWLDEGGYLYIADRRVDVIVTGGANVFPAEVECALIDHPAIADVVVVGLADDTWGRRVHAIVAPEDPHAPPSVDEVIAFAKTRLAAYKVPKTVEFVEAVPRSEATKVNRSALVAARGG